MIPKDLAEKRQRVSQIDTTYKLLVKLAYLMARSDMFLSPLRRLYRTLAYQVPQNGRRKLTFKGLSIMQTHFFDFWKFFFQFFLEGNTEGSWACSQ
jgi:hypothetical protein